MDADLVLIIIASLITLTVVPWVVLNGMAKVRRASASSEGGQLRRSDLEAIVRGAVEDANEPVLRRLETLEAISTDEERAQDRIDAAVLAEALDPDAEPPRPTRRRARS